MLRRFGYLLGPLKAGILGSAGSQSAAQRRSSLRPPSKDVAAKPTRKEMIEGLAKVIFGRGNQFMKITFSLEGLPEGRYSFPEIAFIGGAGSGKSSVLCGLGRNGRLMRHGVRKGTTQGLKFANMGDCIALVDTPGYGAWDMVKLSRQADQARSIGILFQYLALRKKKNLKHVYWCFRGQPEGRKFEPNPRLHELLAFMLYERIPFTPILTRCDLYKGRPAALAEDTERLRMFIGNPKIPIFYTSIAFENSNIVDASGFDGLMYDILWHVCKGVPDEQLSFRTVHDMGFIPYSSAEQMAIERRYPRERIALPPFDYMPMTQWIEQHEQAKIGYAEHKRFDTDASMAQLEDALKMPLVNYKHNLSVEERQAQVSMLLTGEVAPSPGHLALSPWNPFERPIDIGTLADEGLMLEGKVTGEAIDTTVFQSSAPQSAADVVELTTDRESSVAVSDNGGEGCGAVEAYQPPPRTTALTPLQTEIIASGMSPAFPCVLVPDSLLVPTTQGLLAGVDKRSEIAFAQQQESLEDYYSDEGSFITAGRLDADEEAHDGLTAPKRFSRQEKLHFKYMVNNPRREQMVTDDKAMCPWLGAPKEGRVLGVDAEPICAKGGSALRGVKSRGFGGKSVSMHTYKQKTTLDKRAPRWSK